MRRVWMAAAAALALGACGQSGDTAGDAPGTMPNLFAASYRAEANVSPAEGGASMTMVMIRDGAKMRMEFAGPQGPTATIYDPQGQVAYMLMPAQKQAMRIPLDQVMEQSPEEQWQADLQSGRAVDSGPCTGAGETGREWRITDEDGGVSTACVTGDGILLRAASGERVTWETTSLQRGPQAPEAFSVPADYAVTDLSELMNSAKGMMEQFEKQRQAAGQ